MITTADIAQMDDLVCAITGLTAEQLNEMRYEAAYTYLQEVIGTDSYGMQELPKTPEFWAHWRRVWYAFDEQLLMGTGEEPPVIPFDCDARQACSLYTYYHSTKRVALDDSLIHAAWHAFIKTLKTNTIQ